MLAGFLLWVMSWSLSWCNSYFYMCLYRILYSFFSESKFKLISGLLIIIIYYTKLKQRILFHTCCVKLDIIPINIQDLDWVWTLYFKNGSLLSMSMNSSIHYWEERLTSLTVKHPVLLHLYVNWRVPSQLLIAKYDHTCSAWQYTHCYSTECHVPWLCVLACYNRRTNIHADLLGWQSLCPSVENKMGVYH